ncbi:hypothetical protein P7H12_00065 [Paenibacillus larvae]|nr:hypothetical protein [Paenibacillus larvae]MDT2262367.1 hypothetical protein [Paenibacillus larvae]
MELVGMRRAIVLTTIRKIERILADLVDESDSWIEENIPKAAADGVIKRLLPLKS